MLDILQEIRKTEWSKLSQIDWSQNQRAWGALAHASGVLGVAIPIIGNLAGPLLIWYLKKETMPQAAKEAKEALNFQILMALLFMVIVPLSGMIIGSPLIWLYRIALLAIVGMAVLTCSKSGEYRYPGIYRLIG